MPPQSVDRARARGRGGVAGAARSFVRHAAAATDRPGAVTPTADDEERLRTHFVYFLRRRTIPRIATQECERRIHELATLPDRVDGR